VANNAVETRRVPKAALALNIGPMQFAAAREDGVVPVTVLARSAQPIQHWYWGAVVHDMAGFKPAAPSIPSTTAMTTNKSSATSTIRRRRNDGLTCRGQVVPFGDDDRASEVIFKSAKGVPYQASIYFDPDELVIEQVPPGMSAEGQRLHARRARHDPPPVEAPRRRDLPLRVRRQHGHATERWPARRRNRTSHFSHAPTDHGKARPSAANKPATELATEQTSHRSRPPAAAAREAFKATLAKFSAKFGPENGAKWAAEGLSYEAALEKHSRGSSPRSSPLPLTKDNGRARRRSSRPFPAGKREPVSFSTTEKHEGGENLRPAAAKLSWPRQARQAFAANLKMPEVKRGA
jgi:hypothetical protein